MKRFAPFVLVLLAAVLSGCIPFLSSSGYGAIHITSEPEQASIWLDGKDTGLMTPAVLEHVPSGKHKVEARFPGWEPVAADVVVRRDQEKRLVMKLHPKGTSPDAKDAASVYGFVLNNRGGSPVEGATVRAYVSGTTDEVAASISDSDGAYGFNLPPGTYDIVASKSEHAEARRQALAVNAGDDERVDVILKDLFDHGKSAVAPTLSIAYDRGDGVFLPFEPGAVIGQSTWIRVKVDAEHPLYLARVWIGHWDRYADGIIFDVPEFYFRLGEDVDGVPVDVVGENELVIDAYDIQGSWVERRVPFYVLPTGVPATQPRVTGVDLTATTFGADLNLYSHFQIDGLSIDPASFRDDVTLIVTVKWDAVENAQGYEIQRAWSPAGPWRQVARLSALVFDGANVPYYDMSAELLPGRATYYRIRAIGESGEVGEWSTPVSVKPLKRFEVRLVSPQHGAVGVPLNPTFRWEYDDIGAQTYVFHGNVTGVAQPELGATWVFEDVNISEAPFNYDGGAKELLKPAKAYTWGIHKAEAHAIYGSNSRAISLAGYDSGAVDGSFTFVTGNGD